MCDKIAVPYDSIIAKYVYFLVKSTEGSEDSDKTRQYLEMVNCSRDEAGTNGKVRVRAFKRCRSCLWSR